MKYVIVAKAKLNIESDVLVTREQSIFIQFDASNIGGVLHAPILDKGIE